jgi:hypothetical protein
VIYYFGCKAIAALVSIKNIIDEEFSINEINNFRITNNITEFDKDGRSYTMYSGLYPYISSINGYRIAVLVN